MPSQRLQDNVPHLLPPLFRDANTIEEGGEYRSQEPTFFHPFDSEDGKYRGLMANGSRLSSARQSHSTTTSSRSVRYLGNTTFISAPNASVPAAVAPLPTDAGESTNATTNLDSIIAIGFR